MPLRSRRRPTAVAAAWRAFIEAVYAKSGATHGMSQDIPAVELMLPNDQVDLGEDAVGALLKAWEGREGELAFAMVRKYGVYFVKATGSTPLAFIGRDNEAVYKPKVAL